MTRCCTCSFPQSVSAKKKEENKYFTYLGGMFRGERGFSFSMSFFSRASRGGRIFGLSFSSRFIRSLSHSSFRRILSFSRSCSRSLSRSLCRRSRSRWSRSLSLSRFRSRGSRSRSRSLRTEFKVVKLIEYLFIYFKCGKKRRSLLH